MAENTEELKPKSLKFSRNDKGIKIKLQRMLMNVAYDVGNNRFLIATEKGNYILFEEFRKNKSGEHSTNESIFLFKNNTEAGKDFYKYLNLLINPTKVIPATKEDNKSILELKNLADDISLKKLPDYVIDNYNKAVYPSETEPPPEQEKSTYFYNGYKENVIDFSQVKLGVLYKIGDDKFLFGKVNKQNNSITFDLINKGKKEQKFDINTSADYSSWSEELGKIIDYKIALTNLKLVSEDERKKLPLYDGKNNNFSPLSKEIKEKDKFGVISFFPRDYKNNKLYPLHLKSWN